MMRFLSRFFKKKPKIQVPSDSMLARMTYLYINGVAYKRINDRLMYCDFTLPPERQDWAEVPAGEDPQIVNICYALGLAEGAISMVPASADSRGISLN